MNVEASGGGIVAASSTTSAETFGENASASVQDKDSTSVTHWSVDASRDVTVYAFAKPNDGAIFVGWFDTADCTGNPLSAQAEAYPVKKTVNKNTTVTTTLYAKFSTTAAITGASFNPTSLIYDGATKSMPTLTVVAGALTLGAGDYDIISGQTSAAGSPSQDCSYEVTVQGKGNFTGTASATWTIVAPSGSFAADAASGAGCTASGAGVTLTDSLALKSTYDSEKGTWKASMTIAMPAPVTKDADWNSSNGSAKYVKDDTTFVSVGDVSCAVAQSGAIPGLSFANAQGSYASSKNLVGSATTTTFTSLSSLTYTLAFSVADVEAAKAAGKIERSITVWSIVWSGEKNQGHDTGIRATTYTLTIPIDDKLILQDAEGRQVYPPHQHSWSYAVSADGKTLVATCQNGGCPQETLSVGFTGETAKTYDAQPFAAELTDVTEFVKHTGAAIGAFAYDEAADAPVNAGEHTAKVVIAVGGGNYTISQSMTINPAAFDLSLGISSVDYDGAAKTVAATATFGQTTLVEGTDYVISGDDRTQTGSPVADQTYTVTATGKGNFANCEKSATWVIKAPTGNFAADAASGTGCTASDNTVTLTDSLALNPTYDSEKGTWKASMTIAWPAPVNVANTLTVAGHAEYIDAPHAFVQVGEAVYSGSQILDAETSTPNLTAQTGTSKYAQGTFHDVTYTYFKSVTYALEFSVADVEAAMASGKIEKSITVWSIVWKGTGDEGEHQYSNTGLRATTYTLTIPIDDKLILQDTQGRQVYPPHRHSWSYAVSADGKTLVATCGASGCPQETLSVGFTGETAKTYDAQPFVAELTDATEFVKHTGATIGAFAYDEATGKAGDYTARVTITAGGQDYTLAEGYSIATRTLTALTLSATAFDYDATEKSVAIGKVDAGGLTAGSGDYDVLEESVLASKGSGTADQTYVVTVRGKGNFSGEASASWTIKAAGTAYAFGTVTKGCDCGDVEGATLAITKSTGLVYEGNDVWSASITVAVPNSTWQFVPDMTLYFVRNGFRFLANDGSACATNGIALSTSGVSLADYNYVKSFTWTERFTLEEVQAAFSGEGRIVRELRAFSPPWKNQMGTYSNNGGLREVTYAMTIDVTEDYPVLNDEKGVQKYPPHRHDWTIVASGEPVCRLTATCSAPGCPTPELTLELKAESRDYNGEAVTAVLDGAAAFAAQVGAEFGEIAYPTCPYANRKYTGDYVARATVTAGGETYELTKAFSITKPAGGYADGFEAGLSGADPSGWVRYDSLAEAVNAVEPGDTVYIRRGYNEVVTTFFCDKDVTFDFCGNTFMNSTDALAPSQRTIQNTGSGKVTFVNVNIHQSRTGLNSEPLINMIGNYVFGANVRVFNNATGKQTPKIKYTGTLEILDGVYQCKFGAGDAGGTATFKGGKYWSVDDPPTPAEGYRLTEINETCTDAQGETRTLKWLIEPAPASVAVTVQPGEGVASVLFGESEITAETALEVEPGATVAYVITPAAGLAVPVCALNDVTVGRTGEYVVTGAVTLAFSAADGADPTKHHATDAELARAIVDSMAEAAAKEKAAALCGADNANAQAVATWLGAKGVGSAALAASEYAQTSFALGTGLLDGRTVALKDVTFGDAIGFTVAVDSGLSTEEVVNAAKASLVPVVRTAASLGDGFGTSVAAERLAVDGATGRVTVSAEPGATAEFITVIIPKDIERK